MLRCDVGLRKALRRLPLSNLSGCKELFKHLEEDPAEPSVLESFTADVIKRLGLLEPVKFVLAELPPLTKSDMAAVEQEQVTAAKFQRAFDKEESDDQRTPPSANDNR